MGGEQFDVSVLAFICCPARHRGQALPLDGALRPFWVFEIRSRRFSLLIAFSNLKSEKAGQWTLNDRSTGHDVAKKIKGLALGAAELKSEIPFHVVPIFGSQILLL